MTAAIPDLRRSLTLIMHREQTEHPDADMLTLIARRLGITRRYCRQYLRTLGASDQTLDNLARKPPRKPPLH
jgi:hypothetical protein